MQFKFTQTGSISFFSLLVIFILGISAFLFFNLKSSSSASESGNTVKGIKTSGFVKTNGTKLELNGNDYKFIGVNRYDLMTIPQPYRGCGPGWTEAQLKDLFKEFHSIGINVVRIAAFQLFTDSGKDFSRFDYILKLAEESDIKIIPTLGNQWESCTLDGYKFNTWYSHGYKQIGPGYTLSYHDYVEKFVHKYKNNPAILMWQLINEAESKDVNQKSDPVALYNFAKDMSGLVKSIDKNHLVNLGTGGNGNPGTEGDDYRKLYAIGTLDLLELHDFRQDSITPDEIYQRIKDATVLNKPLFIGEAGIKSNCQDPDCKTPQERADIFEQKMQAFFPYGVGYLIWSYRESTTTLQPHDFNTQDPLAAILSKPPINQKNNLIYGDFLHFGWSDWSWNSTNNLTSNTTYAGKKAISFTPKGWSGFKLHSETPFDTSPYSKIHFAFQASQPDQKFNVYFLGDKGQFLKSVSLEEYGGHKPGVWVVYEIPLANLNAQSQKVHDFIIQEFSGQDQPGVFIDEIEFR